MFLTFRTKHFPILLPLRPSLTDLSTCTHSQSTAFRIRSYLNQIFKANLQGSDSSPIQALGCFCLTPQIPFCSVLLPTFLLMYFSTHYASVFEPYVRAGILVSISQRQAGLPFLTCLLSPGPCTLSTELLTNLSGVSPFILYPLLTA